AGRTAWRLSGVARHLLAAAPGRRVADGRSHHAHPQHESSRAADLDLRAAGGPVLILGLDPGSAHSALVVIHAGDGRVEFSAYEPNDEMLYVLEVYRRQWPAVLVIEKIESYGMPVGREVFDTVFFSGMASQVWKGRDV